MKILTLVFILLLSACKPVEFRSWWDGVTFLTGERTPVHSEVLVICDSLCISIYDDYDLTGKFFVDLSSVAVDGISGRKLVQYTNPLPAGYSAIALALATNDVARTPIDEYTSHLQWLISTLPAGTSLYCILPQANIAGRDSTAYRDALIDNCPTVIDPADWGVKYLAHDGKHYNGADHLASSFAIDSIVTEMHNVYSISH